MAGAGLWGECRGRGRGGVGREQGEQGERGWLRSGLSVGDAALCTAGHMDVPVPCFFGHEWVLCCDAVLYSLFCYSQHVLIPPHHFPTHSPLLHLSDQAASLLHRAC